MKTTYYVAINYKHVMPVIVESFDNEIDAYNYALLMHSAKNKEYIVLAYGRLDL